MKKFTRVLLILALLLLAAGCGMTIAGAALGADLRTISGQFADHPAKDHSILGRIAGQSGILIAVNEEEPEDYVNEQSGETAPDTKNGILADTVHHLKLNLRADELIMKTWDKDTIQAVYQDNEDRGKEKITVEQDTLTVTGSRTSHYSELVLYYPEEKTFDSVDIRVDAGEADLEGKLTAGELRVTIGAGEFSASQPVSTQKAELEVGAGEISMSRLKAEELTGNCGMGALNLRMEGSETDYNYKLKCGLGEISIGSSSRASIGGKDEITNPGADCTMSLECGLGEIDIEFTD